MCVESMESVSSWEPGEEHERHRYWLNDHEGGGYAVVAVEEEFEPPASWGWEAQSRDDALRLARGHGVAISVWPCACGECALARYVREHPRSVVRERVQARKWLMLESCRQAGIDPSSEPGGGLDG